MSLGEKYEMGRENVANVKGKGKKGEEKKKRENGK
jgi:hypothetical protein